jgi:starch synthase (maltosyl-transferring)
LQPLAGIGEGRRRAVVQAVSPEVQCGRFPAKRIAGDAISVEADVFADGHDTPMAVLLWRPKGATGWIEAPMEPLPNDRWRAEFIAPQIGRYEFTVAGWVDAFQTWRRDMKKRIEASQDTNVDYLIGADLVEQAAARASASSPDAAWLLETARRLQSDDAGESRRAVALDPMLQSMTSRYPDRRFETRYERILEITADPLKARFSTWYEFFPRSTGAGKHGTFRDCEARLPYVAGMGFDVLYFPPIHPIGTTWRKGPNNTLTPSPDDPGSPWAIGGAEGGHKSIHPELGTLDDFRRLVGKAREFGIDIALDIAFQVSPDHPYAKQHQEWFRRRPDGTIQYAENPPKKYQDIYPFDFESEQWREMWAELKSVFDFWIRTGVRIFRVDNPHTKAFAFWEWCIGAIKAEHPDVLFLSEAFTRPKVMYRLAMCGFSQSYTYFPWRHSKQELTEYFTELSRPPVSDFFRGNHWPNTPDILTEFLQTTGRRGFALRFLLAAALSANYGIYGPAFELAEDRPLRPGSEEYLDSEKYQIRQWETDREDSLRDLIALMNRIRQENPALQNDTSLRFHHIDNENMLAWSKRSPGAGDNLVVVVANLDIRNRQSGYLSLPLEEWGIPSGSPYQVHEMLTGARYIWQGARNFVELDPASAPAHIFAVRRKLRTEREFEYFL